MKTYKFEKTRHKDLLRVVDREGNWTHYLHSPSGKYLVGVTTYLERGYTKGKGFEIYAFNTSPADRDRILKAAGDRGDMVHRAIEAILTFGSKSKKKEVLKIDRTTGIFNAENNDHIPLKDDEWDCLLSFAEFWKRHDAVLVSSEGSVFNLEKGYAGTFDFIAILKKDCGVKSCGCIDIIGRIGLWDAKTSSGIRPSYSAQEAAYVWSDNISDYTPQPITYIGTLRLGTSHKTTGGYQVEVRVGSEAIGEAFGRFTAAKRIADEEHPPFNPAEDIKDIADTIEISIDRYAQWFVAKKSTTKKKTTKKAKKITKKP